MEFEIAPDVKLREMQTRLEIAEKRAEEAEKQNKAYQAYSALSPEEEADLRLLRKVTEEMAAEEKKRPEDFLKEEVLAVITGMKNRLITPAPFPVSVEEGPVANSASIVDSDLPATAASKAVKPTNANPATANTKDVEYERLMAAKELVLGLDKESSEWCQVVDASFKPLYKRLVVTKDKKDGQISVDEFKVLKGREAALDLDGNGLDVGDVKKIYTDSQGKFDEKGVELAVKTMREAGIRVADETAKNNVARNTSTPEKTTDRMK